MMNVANGLVLPFIASAFFASAPAPPVAPEAPAAERSAAIVTAKAERGRAWLGVFLGDALDGGVQLVAVAPGGPADESGLQPGDVILQLGERSVPDRKAIDQALSELGPGEKVRVRFIRGGRVEDRTLTTASRAPAWTFTFTTPLAEELAESALHGADFLGVRWISIPDELRAAWGAPEGSGVLVGDVDAGRAAAEAGLKVGDIVVRVNEHPVSTPTELVERMTSDTNVLAVARRGVRTPVRIAVKAEATAPAAALALERATRTRGRDAQIEQLQQELERLRDEVRRLREELDRARGSE